MLVARTLQLAFPFLWLGLVAAISLIETPLKFRAPGITVPLALGIGRLVFKALNRVELVLGAVLLVLAAVVPGPQWTTALLITLVVMTAVQALWLRPRMDRRVRRVRRTAPAASDTEPEPEPEAPAEAGVPPGDRRRSALHLVYIGLEGLKILVLPVLGTAYAVQALT